jgi:hypothetical protein
MEMKAIQQSKEEPCWERKKKRGNGRSAKTTCRFLTADVPRNRGSPMRCQWKSLPKPKVSVWWHHIILGQRHTDKPFNCWIPHTHTHTQILFLLISSCWFCLVSISTKNDDVSTLLLTIVLADNSDDNNSNNNNYNNNKEEEDDFRSFHDE